MMESHDRPILKMKTKHSLVQYKAKFQFMISDALILQIGVTSLSIHLPRKLTF